MFENVDGVWVDRAVPNGNINGNWKEIIQYLLKVYDQGAEHIDIVRGFPAGQTGTYKFVKRTDNLLFTVTRSANDTITAKLISRLI